MSRAGNLKLVEGGYAALERDDIAAFLEVCAADAEWIYPAEGSLPYGGRWRGLDGISAFLDSHDAAEEILEMSIHGLVADGGQVVAVGHFRGRAKPAGNAWETRFAHVITIRDDRWHRFEAFFDTAAAVEAHRYPT